MRFGFALLGALAVCVPLHATAVFPSDFSFGATVINFDDVVGGPCNLCGPSVTNQYAGQGVNFNNPSFPGQDTVDTNLTAGIPNASLPNALFVFQAGMIGQGTALPFQILFSIPVIKVGFDYGSSDFSFLRLDAYDSGNNLLESLTYTGTPTSIGAGGFAGIRESSNIARLDVSYHPNADPTRSFNFNIDNLRFEGVPEPSTLALAGIGLSMLLAYRRIRR